MQIKTRGIILKQRNIGENDRILTALTAELGIIEIAARGVKSVRSPLSSPSQILAYSEFCLFKGKQSYYIIDSAETVNTFYSLRLDVAKLALAVYFCDLAAYLSPGVESAPECLRLLLNTLHFLQEERQDAVLLKSIFELRILSVTGFMPDLVGCAQCGEFQKEGMTFFPMEGILLCGECLPSSPLGREDAVHNMAPPPVLAAMRHIIFSEQEKLFSFKLAGNSLKQLSRITENYALLHTEGRFQSLSMYHQLEI